MINFSDDFFSGYKDCFRFLLWFNKFYFCEQVIDKLANLVNK